MEMLLWTLSAETAQPGYKGMMGNRRYESHRESDV